MPGESLSLSIKIDSVKEKYIQLTKLLAYVTTNSRSSKKLFYHRIRIVWSSDIVSFSHFLKRVDFNAIVDHLPLPILLTVKQDPATNRIKTRLEVLGS